MTRLAVGAFRVDLGALESFVTALTSTEAELRRLASDLAIALTRAHVDWRGEAALAHSEAQLRWHRALGDLQQAVAALRSVAAHAHASYDAATGANQAMWMGLG